MRQQDDVLAKAALHLPPIEADTVLDDAPIPAYRAIFEHPDEQDRYWQSIDQRGSLPNVIAATHLVSGWYDIFLRETLADYAILFAAGRNPYLTIGPWSHTDSEVGGTGLRQGLIWFDAHLKGDRTNLRHKPAQIYVMGANSWRELDRWPPASEEQSYFLHANGMLSTDQPPSESPPDHYRYDPADPTPSVGGALMSAAGARNQCALEARPDVLCYTTPPLTHAVEVIGEVTLRLYVRSSTPYTDFVGRVCDVHPDGTSLNICDGLLRMAPNTGEQQPDGSVLIDIALSPTAHQFQSGHRIRVQVASGAHPRWHRNFGTGEPVGQETHMVIADQTIYHDRAHPSALVLPVAETASTRD
jgi:putative CocE/NonD family hydrolase